MGGTHATILAGKRRRYNARVQAGLCGYCGNPPIPGKSRCEACSRKQADRDKRRRARRVAAGLCAECGDKAEKGLSKCRWCLDKHNEYTRQKRYELKAAGLCPRCEAPPENDRIYCKRCLRLYARTLRINYHKRKTRRVRQEELRRRLAVDREGVLTRLAALLKRRPGA